MLSLETESNISLLAHNTEQNRVEINGEAEDTQDTLFFELQLLTAVTHTE